ncbi:hypothetical protein J7F03_22575 [Streptomyces sp. ISL-43]|uniref:hypothetical protein n=1 Tax=Streptomyces sp. ISL-43 TaxID=2819183 RepID=UPI001BEC4F19|nr:hypothetical protein [Streptomyces sp. ISL-43]MBT2449807.1 hypothetical protein [Streptomyces sp. ISL-43]
MTAPSAQAPAHSRSLPVVLFVLAAVLLVPAALWWYISAQSALQNKSGTDWQGNHRTKQELQRTGLLIGGVPTAGALTGWMCATLSGRRTGLWAATGALLGTLVMWALAIVGILVSLGSLTFVF